MASLQQFSTVEFETWFSPAKGIRARYWNAGHLLGSASIEIEIDQVGQKPTRILFSGDIGPDNKMLEHDPVSPTTWDYVICESTYGGKDRFERTPDKRRELLITELNDAAKRGGALLIPSFAVERTQEVLTDIIYLMDNKLVPSATIFIDSPLANKASAVFRKHADELQNGDALMHAFNSTLVHTTETVDDSKAINLFKGFYIVIAASGMCEAGRIRHHLRNHLFQASTTVMLVGFQAAGSLGAQLQAGQKVVRIMGEDIQVAAAVRTVGDYSGHADGPELETWIEKRLPILKTLFLTHGENDRQLAMVANIQDKLVPADRIIRPALDEAYDLSGQIALLLPNQPVPRVEHAVVAQPDWNNESQMVLNDLHDTLKGAATDKERSVILRRVKRALQSEDAPSLPADRSRRRPYRARGPDEG